MGRWRPPAPGASPYITPAGAASLKEELERLWRRERPAVTRALAEAAAEGDRSENAEYAYRKKQLAHIDRRVRYLRKRLAVLRVVDTIPADREQVFFGAWVHLEDEAGKVRVHRIVGPDELDPARSWISMDSPLAKALMKCRPGDRIDAPLPGGTRRFVLLAVRYSDSAED